MRIEFKRIELHNFMSFAEESFDFTKCKGMNLIQGKNNDALGSRNGAGKSQLWLSIAYALFGQMPNEMKNKSIVSRTSSKKEDMDVVLEFSVDDKDYKIRRGMTKGVSSYLTLLEIDKDGNERDVTKSTIAETQKHIEDNLLKLDMMMFFRTVLLTADQSYNFYKMRKADKKEFVEKLFDITLFEDMHTVMHKDLLALSRDMDACQTKLMMLNKSNDDYNSKMSSYESLKKQKIDTMTKELEPVTKRLDEAREHMKSVDISMPKKLEEAVSKLMTSYEEALSSQSALNKKASSIDLDIHKLEESCNASNSVISKHKDVLSKLCSDCKKVFIKHYSLDEYAKRAKDAKDKIAELNKIRDEVNDEIASHASDIPKLKDKMSLAKTKLQTAREEIDNASRAVMLLESQVKSKNDAISHLKSESNPYTSLVEQCKADIESESKKTAKVESSMKYLKFAESIVSQETIRKFIIKDLVVLLNNKVKTYLTKLGSNFYVEFDENMDYEFITPTGICEWGNFSAGERARIMIATSFAFRDFMSIRNGLSSSILVLDEYFDSAIDSQGIDSIMALLKEFSDTQNQDVFVVTHRQEVSPDSFDRTILVEKTNGISQVKFI